MPNYNDTGMSDLEREFELEMEGDEGESAQEELESDWESEDVEDREAEEESSEDREAKEEFNEEWESDSGERGDYAQRFYELSQREFESESELDQEVREIVNDMERDYFWGKWKNKLRKMGGSLLKKGLGQLAGQIPGFKGLQALTQLARGDLKGGLGALAKSGLSSAMSFVPGGAVALPALKALGFEATEDTGPNREAWDNYVEVAREAFDMLGRNLDERVADPLEASRLASNAYQSAVRKVQARVRARSGGPIRDHRRRTMTIKLRRGERIIIEGI